MRFNDEVQFTLMCVRVPEPVVLPEPVAQPRVFMECMTWGDAASLGIVIPGVKRNAELMESMSPAPKLRTEVQVLINKMLNDVFDTTVRVPDDFSTEYPKYRSTAHFVVNKACVDAAPTRDEVLRHRQEECLRAIKAVGAQDTVRTQRFYDEYLALENELKYSLQPVPEAQRFATLQERLIASKKGGNYDPRHW